LRWRSTLLEVLQYLLSVLRPDASDSKGGQYASFGEGGGIGRPEQRKEIPLCKVQEARGLLLPFTLLLLVGTLKRTKHHHIKWLEAMGTVRGKDSQENPVLIIIVDEFYSHV
jgi:hypothetical protein